jgi:hypothetical protein
LADFVAVVVIVVVVVEQRFDGFLLSYFSCVYTSLEYLKEIGFLAPFVDLQVSQQLLERFAGVVVLLALVVHYVSVVHFLLLVQVLQVVVVLDHQKYTILKMPCPRLFWNEDLCR